VINRSRFTVLSDFLFLRVSSLYLKLNLSHATQEGLVIDPTSGPQLKASEALAYWTGFTGEHYLRLNLFSRMRSGAEARLRERGFAESGNAPIPRLYPHSITPQRFRDQYVLGYTPVVLKGLGAAWPAIQKWNPQFFKSQYGSEQVCVRVKAGGVGAESIYTRDVSMAELIDDVMGGGEYYANNLEDVFNSHAELRSDLLLPQLEEWSCANPPKLQPGQRKGWRIPRWGQILSTQIFISSATGRTGYHCASGGNFFLQVYGRKRWLFVNPRHTAFIYPIIRKDFIYSSSAVDARMTPEEIARAGYPLYNFVPKYEVVLEPGDVLYSPQWWWHTVDNLSESIGVAMRFRTAVFACNPVYSAMTTVSPTLWRHLFQVVRTGWGTDATGARTFFEPEGAKLDVRLRPSARVPLRSSKGAGS
jgi:hypothetical protein